MSAWQVVRRGMVQFAVLVVVNAALQALLVGVDPRLPMSAASLLIAAASGLALLAAVALLWRITERAALLRRPTRGLVLRTLVVGAVVAAVAIAAPPLVPLVVVAGCAVLAAGGVRPAGSMAARHPWRFTLSAIATVVIVVLAWVLDLLLGLFVTGPAAAAASWVVVGAVAVPLVCHWVALEVRPERPARRDARAAAAL